MTTRAIVCGSRDIESQDLLTQCLDAFGTSRPLTTIISGGASGVDTLAKHHATTNGIEFVEMKANWTRHGRAAGFKRNAEMLKELGAGGVVIALWDGKSRGTKHMLEIAEKGGYEVWLFRVKVSIVAKDGNFQRVCNVESLSIVNPKRSNDGTN